MKTYILDDSRTDSYLAELVANAFFDEVEVFGTPKEFKEAIERSIPDLILMDIHIGDLHNGISIVDEIRSKDSEISIIPVVVVTASKDVGQHQFAIERGASAVIIKPLSAEKLAPLLPQIIPGFQVKVAI